MPAWPQIVHAWQWSDGKGEMKGRRERIKKGSKYDQDSECVSEKDMPGIVHIRTSTHPRLQTRTHTHTVYCTHTLERLLISCLNVWNG